MPDLVNQVISVDYFIYYTQGRLHHTRWSKCTMEEVGGGFFRNLGGVHKFPLQNLSTYLAYMYNTALRLAVMIVAIRCQILRLKCTKFDFDWGSTPDLADGAYSAPQTPYLDLRAHF